MIEKAKATGAPVRVYLIGVDYLRNHYKPVFRLFGYQYQRTLTKGFAKIVDVAFATNEYERDIEEKV